MTLIEDAKSIWMAGVEGVRADSLVEANVTVEDGWLSIGDESFDLQAFDRIVLVGGGKAAAAMTKVLVKALTPHLPVVGWVNVPEGTLDAGQDGIEKVGDVAIFAARPAGMNEPTQSAIDGTKKILNLAASATDRDLCIAVITGGGSALLTLPAEGVSLDEKRQVIRHLSGAGADIESLNTVRKQLSQIKGGGLLRACNAGCLVTVVLSDVLGDPLDVIASGPTVVNHSKPSDALDILKCFDPERILPESIYHAIQKNQIKESKSEFTPASSVVVLGNNATAVDAAGIKAESLGYSHAMTSAISGEGAASEIGVHLADMAVSMLHDRDAGKNTPDCLISGGEPTVELAPPAIRGRGGRNMHLVLAAMQRLIELNVSNEVRRRIVILSGGTDGEDGPTTAAGAVLCCEVWERYERLKLDPKDFLRRSDSFSFFEQTGGLLVTGPTHTNVCDLRVVTVDNGKNTS